MIKQRFKSVLSYSICLSVLSIASVGQAKLNTVNKPDTTNSPTISPRTQPILTKKVKEMPFVETAAKPKATNEEKERGYILFSRPITQPIYKNTRPLKSESITGLSAFATNEEFEPLTFSLYPLRDMKSLRVTVSELSMGDQVIGKEHLDLRLNTYWKTRYPLSTSKKNYRVNPELLEKVTVNSFPKEECQRYWLKVRVPKEAKPGIYQGHVTIFDDLSTKAIQVPIKFRVLDFQLKKDPKKHYSVFHYPPHIILGAYKGKLFDKALTADLQGMLDYGIDLFPTIYLKTRVVSKGNVEFYIPEDSKKVLEKGMALGFKGPIYCVAQIDRFYKHFVPGGKIGSHYHLSKIPTDGKMLAGLEASTKKFKASLEGKGYHEFIFCPVDEPRAPSADFIAQCFAAIRRGGIRTIITNDPTSGYSKFYRQHDALDYWCSQGFTASYHDIIADEKVEYWSYPNHNAAEIRDALIMQKGGRMTYGFGLWRSGYTTLIPWIWRWFPGPKKDGMKNPEQFDYFIHKRVTGCGMRLDEQANLIPTPYWECFREGYDDARYLYTLQQAIFTRAQNPACKTLVKYGKKLINDTWLKIEKRKKYMTVDFFDDKSFNRIRWAMAQATSRLLKHKGNDSLVAPSVMANTHAKSIEKDELYYIEKGMADGNVEFLDLSANHFAGWKKTSDKEMTFSIIKDEHDKDVMLMDLSVDYKVDGKNKNGKYPIGWPYMFYPFSKETSSKNYDSFYCKIKFDSTRDAVSDNVTRFNFALNGKTSLSETIDLGGNERAWQTIQIPFKEDKPKGLTKLVLLPCEHYYPDETNIKFSIAKIGLIKFKNPIITNIKTVDFLLNTDKKISADILGYGFEKGLAEGYTCRLALLNAKGKMIGQQQAPLSKNLKMVIHFNKLSPGKHRLTLSLFKKDTLISKEEKSIRVIKGFAQ